MATHPKLEGIIYCFNFETDDNSNFLPYIGHSTLSLEERWIWHMREPVNRKVKEYIEKYGSLASSCNKSVLETVIADNYENLIKNLLERELYWIKELDTIENGLNIHEPSSSNAVIASKLNCRPYECSICKWRFCSKTELNEHTELDKGIPNVPFFCLRKTCRKIFNSVEEVFLHMDDEHPTDILFPCTQEGCEENFLEKKELFQHFLEFHKMKLLACKWKGCSEKFTSIEESETHMDENHMKDVNYPCKLCEQTFKRKRFLVQHLKNEHVKMKPSPCKWKGCLEKFTDIEEAKKHMDEIHMKDVNYPCDLCEETFKRKRFLDKHLEDEHRKKRKETQSSSKQAQRFIK